MKKSSILSLALLTSSIAFAEQDEHREHGAHQHGHATLSVIIENNDLMVMIESPAMNVFGFEHKPENKEQHKAVEEAIKDLKAFDNLVALDKKAECSLVKSNIKQPFEMAKNDHEDDHHKEGHEEKHDDDHKEYGDKNHKDDDHKDHDEDHKESTHSDVDVEVSYQCKNASKLSKMDLTSLFKRFPLFVELDAQSIINGQQSAEELNSKQPVFLLNK